MSEDHAARTIQIAVQRRRAIFATYAPFLFSRKTKGRRANFGRFQWSKAATGDVASHAPFAVVSDETNVHMLWSMMMEYWHVPPPKVLISVTGGAQDFSLPMQLHHAFTTGLAAAVREIGTSPEI